MLYTLFLISVWFLALIVIPWEQLGATIAGMFLGLFLIAFITGIFTWSLF
jgi:hypothetical protein